MAVVSYHLQPIDILVSDPVIAENLRWAFKDYANNAINQLNAYVDSLKK